MSTRLFRPFQRIATSSLSTTYRTFHSTSPNMVVHNVRSAEEWKETLAKHPVVLLDCFATWCGPCKAIAPHLVKHSDNEEFKDVHFVKIDVDEVPDVSQELGIRAMPTFMFFKDGNKAQELVGANPPVLEKTIKAVVKEYKDAEAEKAKAAGSTEEVPAEKAAATEEVKQE
ncbi:thioredoxin-like protein [Colletotrichum phormii]|uniref:Thioredoxin-like protein n=1 Tax=Colletotrichum phormii TaxID=359342 RepID=A0AAI9ZGR7_9PEZI|nr:thioredoxin-like protein [Colletotrichum phormii]KAK1623064.1 thioredoxin-like protein [Colletotrichum phormii]